MKKIIFAAIIASMAVTAATAASLSPDEKDYDESVRLPVRRLHPEREFDKAMKQMHKEHEEKAAREEKKKSKHDNRVIPERQKQSSSSADKSLMRELLSKDYSIKKYEPIYEQPKPITWKDDPVSDDVDGLMTHVSASRKGGATLYAPKGVSMASDANEVFFCFESSNGRASSRLHLRVQYYADDPLHYNDILFTIDGFDYTFHPSHPSRGKLGSRMYWEQSEDPLVTEHKDLVYALSHCHWARMSLKGADGMNHVKMLTQNQLDAFACTLELYRAMGGSF